MYRLWKNLKTKMDTLFKVAIVVPCYNEAKRIYLADFENHIKANANHFFCFVNDGSTDDTLNILKKFSEKLSSQVTILDNGKNLGKAETVRQGVNYMFAQNKFDIIGFLDADLATPLFEIVSAVKAFENPEKQLVFGSRIKHLGGNVERRFFRYLLGRIFATVVSNWILKIPVYDTQCGFKFFRKTIIKDIFFDAFISKWFFDIELFCRAIQTKKDPDINVIAQEKFLSTWKDVSGSKIKLIDYFKVPYELIKLKFYYRL